MLSTVCFFVMSPYKSTTLSIGAISCRSTDTILTVSEGNNFFSSNFFEITWLQLPGAAHKSIALSTAWNILKTSSIYSNLYADLARNWSSFAFL